MHSEKLSNGIFRYTNAIDNPENVINFLETIKTDKTSPISDWKTWNTSGENFYVFGKQKQENVKAIKDNYNEYNSCMSILSTIKKSIIDASNYYKIENSLEDIGTLAPLSFSKYDIGAEMGPHTDSDPRGKEAYKENGSIYMPTISVLLYLNDNYKGGELYFKEFNLTVKPIAGSIVIFPSLPPYYHASLPLISGIKYISPGFWNIKNPYINNI
jgi:predicted 2-oxoglutarate/Fe(II)-dependent dioxygenase YbiX